MDRECSNGMKCVKTLLEHQQKKRSICPISPTIFARAPIGVGSSATETFAKRLTFISNLFELSAGSINRLHSPPTFNPLRSPPSFAPAARRRFWLDFFGLSPVKGRGERGRLYEGMTRLFFSLNSTSLMPYARHSLAAAGSKVDPLPLFSVVRPPRGGGGGRGTLTVLIPPHIYISFHRHAQTGEERGERESLPGNSYSFSCVEGRGAEVAALYCVRVIAILQCVCAGERESAAGLLVVWILC